MIFEGEINMPTVSPLAAARTRMASIAHGRRYPCTTDSISATTSSVVNSSTDPRRRPLLQSSMISQLTSPHETITSCHPGYAIPNSNRVPDGTCEYLHGHFLVAIFDLSNSEDSAFGELQAQTSV
jgi:hypothetical protein